MVELNHRQRTIKIKIVYYGPAVGGKTTNLQVLHRNAVSERRGEMVSIHSAQDRTILFDLLPLKAAGFRGFELRLQLAAVPGQAMYAATRRLVLKGADSVVFVANSAADRWDENVQSFREMAENLIAHQLDPSALPLVLQYNKRDLPEVTPMDFMDRALNARKVPALPAVAIRGEGVLETFSAVLGHTMEDLAVRYQVVDLGRGQPLQKWLKGALIDMFGGTTFSTTPGAEATEGTRAAVFYPPTGSDLPAEDRRSFRIDLPEDALRLASFGPSARANESLVDSYADVTARLGSEMADLREQKERLRRFVEQLQMMVGLAQGLIAGQPREPTLRSALEPLAAAGGSRHATFVAPSPEGVQVVALRGLQEDPLARQRSGRRELDRLLNDTEPRVHHSADSLDLGEALQDSTPVFASVATVPLRTASGLHALAVLYFDADEVVAGPAELGQLRALASMLAPALELADHHERLPESERSSELALIGLAALNGMPDVLDALLQIRDELGLLRREPDLPRAALARVGQLTPGLSEALAVTRALLAFGRGEVPPGDVAELPEVLATLAQVLDVEGAVGPAAVRADPILLRLALASLADALRPAGTPGRVLLRVSQDGSGTVKLKLAAPSPSAPFPRAADPRLTLARRLLLPHGGTVGVENEDGRDWTVLALRPA
jgi:signal recognition particle receptor subunit beta